MTSFNIHCYRNLIRHVLNLDLFQFGDHYLQIKQKCHEYYKKEFKKTVV
jgi:hypothetical protein